MLFLIFSFSIMRPDTLVPIAATDPLAQLFNQYLKGLSCTDSLFTPRLSMRECRRRFQAGKPSPTARRPMTEYARVFYELTVLHQSLHDLHACVAGAVTLLEDFFTTYQGDLHRYATENRRASLQRYQSPESIESEDAAAEADEFGEDDADSLTYYTLQHELGEFFCGPENDINGEYIGSSSSEDFAFYTRIVATQADHTLHKHQAAMKRIFPTRYRTGPNGEREPLPLGEQLEEDLNADIRNARVANAFNHVLTTCSAAAELYTHLDPDVVDDYRLLLEGLQLILHTTA